MGKNFYCSTNSRGESWDRYSKEKRSLFETTGAKYSTLFLCLRESIIHDIFRTQEHASTKYFKEGVRLASGEEMIYGY
jgi:hypothetical protein